MVQAVVRSLRASPVSEILVVVGHRAAEIEANLEGSGARCVHNPRYPEGMLTSIQAGIAAADIEAEWFLIALADQPSLRPETVSLLLQSAEEGLADGLRIFVPSFNDRRGHPLILHAGYRAEILAMEGEGGLRVLLHRHPEAVRHVPMPDEAVLSDMDTPEDYQRELERSGPTTTVRGRAGEWG